MPVLAGVNSYGSLEEADAYFEEREETFPEGVLKWSEYSVPQRSGAMLYATEWMEQKRFIGIPVSLTQPLHFPARYYDRSGNSYEDTPVAIKHAQFELAMAHLQDSLVEPPDNNPAVQSVGVGPIKVGFVPPRAGRAFIQAGDMSPIERPLPWVERLLKPWIRGGNADGRVVRV